MSEIRCLFRRCACLPIFGLALLVGCSETVDVNKHQQLQQQSVQRKIVDELFNRGISLIGDVEQADSLDLIDQSLNSLNQWADSLKPLPDWQVDPLAATLSDELKKSTPYTDLEKLTFRRGDTFSLQEAIWLRNSARHVAGKISDPVAKASALFDWTMLQIALVNEADQTIPHAVWETMLRGRGSAVDRIWTFMLLARQQGLDVVALAVERDGKTTPWAAGLLHQKQLYIFDAELGVLVRNADGKVATLAEIAAKPELLAALAVDGEKPYRVSADDLKHVVALVDGSPPYLSQRFRHVELRLVGEDRLVLSVDASALVEQLKQDKSLAGARLWTMPWEQAALARKGDKAFTAAQIDEMRPFRVPNSLLWKGRVLHLMGKHTGDLSAVKFYLESRPTGQELSLLKDAKDPRFADLQLAVPIAKQDATYWLGLVSFERGNYPTAIEYFTKRLLEPQPDTRWKSAAEFMIARAYEAAGEKAKAIEAYGKVTGPAANGAKLRAKLLKS
jgi:tetratricopeptide (TPR) repeat protein